MSSCKDYDKFEKQIKAQQEDLSLLRFELNKFKSDFFKKSKKKKPPKHDPPQPTSKKKGGLFGHIGWFRAKPGRIDKIEKVSLSKCPSCGGKDINECTETEEHVQEDIVLPEIEVTLFRKRKYSQILL